MKFDIINFLVCAFLIEYLSIAAFFWILMEGFNIYNVIMVYKKSGRRLGR